MFASGVVFYMKAWILSAHEVYLGLRFSQSHVCIMDCPPSDVCRASTRLYCFGGHLSLKPRLPCKQTSVTLSSQIDVCDSEPLLLLLKLTKQLSLHCINMPLNTNKHTHSSLSFPMSGTKQSYLTSNTIANIV